MDEIKVVSIADTVFNKLESEILGNIYKAGDIITELKLCQALGVSRTPVREALKRLRQEGLVEETAKGYLVIGITEKDINDIYEVRTRVEGLASSMCAKEISDEQIEKLRETLELQEFYTQKGLADSIKKLDSEFHKQIYSYCKSRTLSTLLCELHRKVQHVRRLSVENPKRAEAAVAEHREIFLAIRDHNCKLAEELTVKHIRSARESVLKSKNDSERN